MNIKLTQECGQRWYRLSSWRYQPWWRVLGDNRGVAFGPIMLFWRYDSR